MANEKNQQTLSSLKDSLTGIETFYVVDYQGLTAGQLSKLRKDIREKGGQLIVAKNTLINLALQAENRGEGAGVGVEKLRDGLGTASTEEEVDALREIIEATGAAEIVERWITQRSQRAIETITSARLGSQISDELVEMTLALSVRKF